MTLLCRIRLTVCVPHELSSLHSAALGIQPLFDLSSAPILPKAGQDAKDSSEALAAKLMMGWAMLDETCSLEGCSGDVPLMRDKKGLVG